MKFKIRFRINNRYGKGSVYSLKEFCIAIVDRYSLTEVELCTVVTLLEGEEFSNHDMKIKRIK